MLNILVLVTGLIANGLVGLSQIYTIDDKSEIPIPFQNKAARIIIGLSAIIVMVLPIVVFFLIGWGIALIMVIAGFIAQKLLKDLAYNIVIVPVYNMFYKNK